MDAAIAALSPLAEKYFADCKANNSDPEVYFFYTDAADDDSDIAGSLRHFANLSTGGPYLALIDIPSQKKYVMEGASEPSTEMASQLLEGYLKETLKGVPLTS